MPNKKIKHPVTLFCAIEKEQHNALRFIKYKEKKSLAEIVREALYIYCGEIQKISNIACSLLKNSS